MQETHFIQLSEQWKPKPYQMKAVQLLLEQDKFGLVLAPGLGKTSITLAAIKVLKEQGFLKKVLLISPLLVGSITWPNEIKKWSDFNGLRYSILHGPKKDDALAADADIYIANPEGLDWLLQAEKTVTAKGKGRISVNLKRFKALGFDTLVIDELSKFKHINTNRFKTLKLVLGTFSRRWGLTGSLAPNGLMDVFGQCYTLDQGAALGQYITHYRSNYFEQDRSGYNWVLRKGAETEIYERINPLFLRMSAEDYLDMPELIENNIYVDLPPSVKKVYDTLEDDLIAKIGTNVVVASTAAAASVKCRQVANGGIYLDSDVEALIKLPKTKKEWVNLHTEKIDALANLIEELQGSPLLVAYEFKHDLDRLQDRLGKEIPYIGGGVPVARSTEIARDWNAGKIPVLIGHPQSMAHGLNLQEVGNNVCWHSLTWNYELYDQFIRRVLRQGNKEKHVMVHHILARGTIDELVLRAVKSKHKVQDSLYEALKNLREPNKMQMADTISKIVTEFLMDER